MNKKLIFLLIIGAALIQFACKKDGGDNGPPTVTNVRIVDSTKRDSFFTSAVPGTQIVIQGNNLSGVQAVYFNDTSAYFNPVYNTGSSLIVTIPGSAQTKATDPNVPSIIRIVTDHGTVEYPFTLYLNGPYITSLSFDNTGKVVTINGGNFQGIQKIVFPTANKDTALSYTVNKAFNQIMAVIPPQTALPDSVRVYCTYGVASYVYPPPMSVTSVSNENAIGGTTITVTGTNFIGISGVTFPGSVVSTDITPIDVSRFSVKVPFTVNSPDYLTVTGALGSTASPQPFATYITHPSPGYLSTFDVQYNSDNTGFVGWTGGYADASTATSKYPNATGGIGVISQSGAINPAATGTPFFGYNNPYALQLNDVPWVANTSDLVSGYSLKFEIYPAVPWTAGALWISVGDWNSSWKSYAARYAPWSLPGADGKFNPQTWVTVTIPLTDFITGNEFYNSFWNPAGNPATKFTDYPNTGIAFLFGNDDPDHPVPANSVQLGIDNVRIVKGQ